MSKSRQHKLNWFTRRRAVNSVLTAGGIGLLMVMVAQQERSLGQTSFTTGYLLMGCLLFLAAFHWRKKLAFLPAIGTAACWMQLHIYVGLATFAVFGIHIGWQVPSGNFEIFLAALYLIVGFSGVYGLYATRVFPARLTAIREEVIFERIPWLRQQLVLQARQRIAVASTSTDVLAKFYANRLAKYLERPRGLVYLVRPSGRMRRQLISEIEDLDRYLAEEHRVISRDLGSLVQRKDDLDYHQAIQGRLKIWLFVHVGLTYSLLAVSILHLVLVHAFHGGMP